MVINITAVLLLAIVAFVLALLFDWFPGLASWYEKFSDGQKRGIMALLLLIASIIIFMLGCFRLFDIGIACTSQGALQFVVLLISAIAINQGTHTLLKPPSTGP